jgi:phosphoglucosamine mutase
MQVLAKSKKSLSELAAKMQKYPQVLINVKDVKKEKLAASTKISDFISEQEKALGNTGRILVRASGTESLIRVMVEAQEMQSAQKIADSLAELVRSELK